MIMVDQDTMPLVSIRILTYNSSNYIVETLDSVFQQTYPNIELVISDDCSKDNTVDVCKAWIEAHGSRFKNVIFLTVPQNTGVCANSKRSLEATTGDWIKGLGGDDCLYPNAIEEFVRFVQEQQCEICACRMDYMDENSKDLDKKPSFAHAAYINNLQYPYEKQYRMIKEDLIVPGPVLFYSRKVYETTGGPDPKYGPCDEWSFIYKVLKAGFRIMLLDKILLRYRIRTESLTRYRKMDTNHVYIKNVKMFMKDVLIRDAFQNGEFLLGWHLYIKYLRTGKRGKMKFLNLLDPLWYIEKTKNKK